MSLYGDIRAGLVRNLSSLGIQSTGYLLQAPTPPVIEISPRGTAYDSAFGRGLDEGLWMVRITVAVSLEEGAQRNLDSYLERSGANSVKALIEAEKTLGGVVQSLRVENVSAYEAAIVDGKSVLSADWTVRIYQ